MKMDESQLGDLLFSSLPLLIAFLLFFLKPSSSSLEDGENRKKRGEEIDRDFHCLLNIYIFIAPPAVNNFIFCLTALSLQTLRGSF